ncbi:hypothetical protein MMC25_006198 [Agyrium rufum]|nr:hypothetical protein [Agyrium rufum]
MPNIRNCQLCPWDIQALGQRLAAAANQEVLLRRGSSKATSREQHMLELKLVLRDIRRLLARLEDAVPLINLAITTSGVSLSTALPSTISPSRLLQASTFLTAGDMQYTTSSIRSVQIGPTFTLSLYMLFLGHMRPNNENEIRETTWKEVLHKTRVKLLRIPLDSIFTVPSEESQGLSGDGSSKTDHFHKMHGDSKGEEFAYQIMMTEDLEDDRVHTFEDGDPQPGPFDEVRMAGIREVIPIHEISKIFYADTGKILNINSEGETNSPILLLKRDLNAVPPRRMMDHYDETPPDEPGEEIPEQMLLKGQHDGQSEIDAQIEREHRSSSILPPNSPVRSTTPGPDPWRIPSNLDPEWLAFEVYSDSPESDEEADSAEDAPTNSPPKSSRATSLDPRMTRNLANLDITSTSPGGQTAHDTSDNKQKLQPQAQSSSSATFPAIKTSLSLLETLIRLLSLQQFQQTSHLSIPDEFLNFFLSESATTGAAQGDERERRRLRDQARRRVGFDPYDESPVKRRGEEYQYHGGESQWGGDHPQAQYGLNEELGYDPAYDSWRQDYDGEEQDHNDYEPNQYEDLGHFQSDEGYATNKFRSPTPQGMVQQQWQHRQPQRSDKHNPARQYSHPFRQSTPATPPLMLSHRSHHSFGYPSPSPSSLPGATTGPQILSSERANKMPPLPKSPASSSKQKYPPRAHDSLSPNTPHTKGKPNQDRSVGQDRGGKYEKLRSDEEERRGLRMRLGSPLAREGILPSVEGNDDEGNDALR